MKVFLDPGHGGADPGAVNSKTGLKEAEVNLDVCKRLEDILTKRGDVVKLSRTTNVQVGLAQRADMANAWGADVFVSVHCNSAVAAAANGIETFYYKGSKKGEQLAKDVQKQLVAQMGLQDRGVKTANFSVLRNTKMPAILTELGFISNSKEEKILTSPTFRQKYAKAIADGVIAYGAR